MGKGELRRTGVQWERDFMEGVGILWRTQELPGWKTTKCTSQHPCTGTWMGILDSRDYLERLCMQSRKFWFVPLFSFKCQRNCVAQNRRERRFCGWCTGMSRVLLLCGEKVSLQRTIIKYLSDSVNTGKNCF